MAESCSILHISSTCCCHFPYGNRRAHCLRLVNCTTFKKISTTLQKFWGKSWGFCCRFSTHVPQCALGNSSDITPLYGQFSLEIPESERKRHPSAPPPGLLKLLTASKMCMGFLSQQYQRCRGGEVHWLASPREAPMMQQSKHGHPPHMDCPHMVTVHIWTVTSSELPLGEPISVHLLIWIADNAHSPQYTFYGGKSAPQVNFYKKNFRHVVMRFVKSHPHGWYCNLLQIFLAQIRLENPEQIRPVCIHPKSSRGKIRSESACNTWEYYCRFATWSVSGPVVWYFWGNMWRRVHL